MKKLFALLFSFQLIITPVFAADAQNVPGTEEDAYMTTGTGDKKKNGGYDFYASQILTLGTSAVGTSIITGCTLGMKIPSVMIFFGGSVAHMASEFLGAKSSNEDHKARLKDLKIKESELATKGDSAQKAVLEQRLTEEKATLKFLNNRKMWMTAVSVIYGTAMGFAISEALLNDIPTPNPFYQMFTGGCVAGKGGWINWGMLLSMAYGMGMSKTGNGGAISQYGTMLITLMNVLVPTLSSQIGVLYNLPLARSITFGASFALAGVVTSGLYVRAGKAKKNIEKLEKVIAQFKANSEGTPTGIVTDTENDAVDETNDPTKVKNSVKALVETKKKQCISLTGGNADISEAACAKKISISKVNGPASFNLPTMNKVNNLTADLGNALASGDEAKAAQIAGEIGSYAARVQSETDALKNRYNEIQKKNNKPTVDFDKSIKEQVASMQGSLDQAAASKNMDIASLGSGAALDEEPAKTADSQVVTTSAPAAVAEVPVDPLAGLGGTEEVTLPEVKTASASQSLDDFESAEQDISKKPETSIFKQLSNRYILNYTKMFETKKSLDPAKDAPAN